MQRSECPISTTLDLVGDRWTLVILRDMLNGKTRYAQFLDSPERITTNVLAVRLKQMEADGLILKTPYQLKPRRYEYVLTEQGRALHGVLKEMCRWANAYYPKTWTPPEDFMT
ncbi:helix-turn-helix domain-containing protein [Phaeobacter sp. HF9A]|uniref:winged helix-turn-helix transcriptional regulator n=1 Tax=Phaeobacter sp. HF9A TaxID=2721561 RepID=UPI001C375A31|nr:helix-turn-helix domain-containing protein [Phaeobacter sp. HF9A]